MAAFGPSARGQRAAQTRLADTVQEQATTLDAVRSHRPLDAETDVDRKLSYIQSAVGVDRGLAGRIANYADPRKLPLTPSQAAAAESIQGNSIDFLPISFLEVGALAMKAVARVAFPNRQPHGTGFLVSPRLFLTNQHVLRDAAAASGFLAEFRFEVDAFLQTLEATRFQFAPNEFFFASREDDLDFALVALGGRVDGAGEPGEFGFLPLLGSGDKHVLGGFINIVQHPAGRPKEVVIRENRILARTDNTLIYGADTLPGASGSAVFNDQWEVVALHHYGSPFRAIVDVPDLPRNGNEGIRMSAIVARLEALLPMLPASQAALLQEALNPARRTPSLLPVGPHESAVDKEMGRVAVGDRPTIAADGTATWTVPITVSVRVGGQSPATGGVGRLIPGVVTREAKPPQVELDGSEAMPKPDPNYGGRQGYNPNFLGVPVSMPKLSSAQRKLAAKVSQAAAGDDPFELKYQNFSVVLNRKRRLPFFTAVNIDGGSVVRIDRKSGKVTHVETPDEPEAYEKWYVDPRVDEADQTDQSLYDDDELNEFQRGHLVKRTDPSWGTAERALKGQADTFHFANCAPQHQLFNPIKTRWAGVEDWITRESDDDDLRVTVFSGCVFKKTDPTYGYLQVPLAFWKVITWIKDGEQRALAIVADQGDLLGEVESAEELGEFPSKLPAEYQVTIAGLEKLVGLNFGSLRDCDTFEGGDESMGGESAAGKVVKGRRPIHSYEGLRTTRPGPRSARSPRPPRPVVGKAVPARRRRRAR